MTTAANNGKGFTPDEKKIADEFRRQVLKLVNEAKVIEDKYPDEFARLSALLSAINVAVAKSDYNQIRVLREAFNKDRRFDVREEGKAKGASESDSKAGKAGEAREAKGRAKEPPKVDPSALEELRRVREERGFSRAELNAWIILNKPNLRSAAKAYLDLIFAKAEVAGRESYVKAYFERLSKGPMTDEEFKAWLASQSENVRKHEGHWDGVRQMANRIWSTK